MGIPVIGLFGHTNPWRVGPYAKFHDLVIDRYTDSDEAPDPAHYGPRPGRMPMVTVSDVLERVDCALERYGVGHH
jgi:heptosyltransferase I